MGRRSVKGLADAVAALHLAALPASQDLLARASSLGLPADMIEFYTYTNGAWLHACTEPESLISKDGKHWKWILEPIERLISVADYGYVRTASPLAEETRRWIRFWDVQDANCLAVDTAQPTRGRIFDCFHEDVGEPGCNRIVAATFVDCLERLLESSFPFWLADDFEEIGVV